MKQFVWLGFLIGFVCQSVSAQRLLDVNVVDLPEHQVKIIFRFQSSITMLPLSFKTRNPERLVIDFPKTKVTIPFLAQQHAWVHYRLFSERERVRVSIPLKGLGAYTERTVGGTYAVTFVREAKCISLNFQDIPVRKVLQVLAEFTGLNMVVSDSVIGNITLKLESVPWDEALEMILTTKSLDKKQVGKVMFIAPIAEIAAREKHKALPSLQDELIQVNHAKADEIALLLKDKTNHILSERGAMTVDLRTNSIWIQDTAVNIEQMRSFIKKLDSPVKQVLIEARIVDVTKDVTEDFGIAWGVSTAQHISGTLAGADKLANSADKLAPLKDRLNIDLGAQPMLNTPASVGIALAKLGAGIMLDLELSALESEGRGEIIASPRLITANQEEALIQAGEDIPYQQSMLSGATAVAFKKAVLSLKVTPKITSDDHILMQIKINQDRPSTELFNGVPAILTKELNTNVLIQNGQTIVLGGIYKRDKSNTVVRVPFFGTLPVVGSLFKRTSVSVKNEELLIFITPKIITDRVPT